MRFSIHKSPARVLLLGLVGFALYFALAVVFFSRNEYYILMLGSGLFGIAILLVKSLGSAFVSSLTLTEHSIETVTSVGGIISIRFDDLDLEQTKFADACLLLVPRAGESLVISVAEYSRKDIARIAHHIANSYGIQEVESRGEA
jgi:hypothetical protein